MRSLLIIVASACLLFACKKGKAEFTVIGILTDTTFDQPLSGASVSLYEVAAGNTGTTLIGTSTLGSDGKYSFTFPRNQAESYTLIAEKSGYFTIEESIFFNDLSIEQDNVENFSTTAKAWVKLRFTNEVPNASTDILSYTKQSGKSGCFECHPTEQQILTGVVDTVIRCATDGNTTFSYLYNILGGGQGVKSEFATAFDTTEIILNY